jgi:ligand-binding SRPBCC domain-containing protein
MATQYRLERVQTVPRPPDDVFAFYADPGNLSALTPTWLGFTILTPDVEMQEGLRIDYRVRPLGVPQRWTSVITVWDPPHRFVDEQVRGPYSRWHHLHEFRAVGAGTEIRDTVEYRLPFGLLGRTAHWALVRHQLRAIFDYRERRIRELFG